MKAIIFPGQGAQYKGMGKDLFKLYRTETQEASQILGFDIEALCTHDPEQQLGLTQFTQPALYTVSAFTWFQQQTKTRPDYLAGHSLGEYNALLAAGAFDFITGLKLVKKRGELMSRASGGGMAAILGTTAEHIRQMLKEGGFEDIDVANFNTPSQIVIAGPKNSITAVVKMMGSQRIHSIPLNVSAPFHSRYMEPAAAEFTTFLKTFYFSPLQTPVIANATARPYTDGQVANLLSQQITGSVLWTDSVRLLMGYGVTEFEETGGTLLTKMVTEIRKDCAPITTDNHLENQGRPATNNSIIKEAIQIVPPAINGNYSERAMRLGNQQFKEDYGVRYAYVAGSMYRGISSKELVIRMAKAGLLSFLGTGGMTLQEIETNIRYLKDKLTANETFGLNLLHHFYEPETELQFVTLYLKYGIRHIEAAAFMQVTEALVYFRLSGISQDKDGRYTCLHKIIAKLSHPEVAAAFMSPAPEKLVRKLMDRGLISAAQAAYAPNTPMADDICVEGDSGGHTDSCVALVLLPAIQELRSSLMQKHRYAGDIRIGLAGGIGSPQAVSCAFIMGADFVLTGSINQCTVAAGTSDAVKDMLQDINIQDTDYAPAGDMFEMGARVQVLKKGVLFPARANRLYQLYGQYESLEEIPEKIRFQLERDYFKKSIRELFEELKNYYTARGREHEIIKAESQPKHKMALIFRWYFRHSSKLAFEGDPGKRINFQVHTGPALGAFNQWVKGTELENWRNRHADQIAIRLMEAAAQLLSEKTASLFS